MIDQSNYVPSLGEELDKVEDPPVQRDGYRTLEQMVREFESAGEQLEEYRRQAYQYEGPGAEDVEKVSLFDDPDAGPSDIASEAIRISTKVEGRSKMKVEEKKVEEKKEGDKDAGAPVVDSGS